MQNGEDKDYYPNPAYHVQCLALVKNNSDLTREWRLASPGYRIKEKKQAGLMDKPKD